SHFAGRTESFFNALARPDRQPEPGVVPGRALRVASFDIGGGSTDLAIFHYQLYDGVGANLKITAHLLFRVRFKVGGDDLLLVISLRWVLPPVQRAWHGAGVAVAAALLAILFGDSGRIDNQAILGLQTALQFFMPLG
ncbi:virulence factor SrfB, partial [Salmonella enterica subsp. enterica serovar Kentucky]|uniref:virulence factor SrfB n=1 Tax=Salmonella enterica TaxID=28901 RepID=UPI003F4C41EF